MSPTAGFFLGIIQGLTEFLPVSSSGHLVLVQNLFGFDASLWFDIVLHLGSLTAVVIFFRASLYDLGIRSFKAILAGNIRAIPRLVWLVILATIPATLFGVVANDLIEKTFASPGWLPWSFLVTAAILWWASRSALVSNRRPLESLSWIDALVVGVFQALAIFPGISRSGSTYSGGVSRGLKPYDAFHFSFLMAIPAIAGAFILESAKLDNAVVDMAIIVGFLASVITSLLALFLLRMVLKSRKLHYFSWYCVAMAAVSVWLFWIV